METLAIACDHAGYNLKNEVVLHLKNLHYNIVDLGCDSTESVDYPNYAKKAAEFVLLNNSKAVLICGSGIGMAIAANRFKRIRAVNCQDETQAYLARAHNDANILTLGSRFIDIDKASKIIKIFLETKFESGRHLNRINKIDEEDW